MGGEIECSIAAVECAHKLGLIGVVGGVFVASLRTETIVACVALRAAEFSRRFGMHVANVVPEGTLAGIGSLASRAVIRLQFLMHVAEVTH